MCGTLQERPERLLNIIPEYDDLTKRLAKLFLMLGEFPSFHPINRLLHEQLPNPLLPREELRHPAVLHRAQSYRKGDP